MSSSAGRRPQVGFHDREPVSQAYRARTTNSSLQVTKGALANDVKTLDKVPEKVIEEASRRVFSGTLVLWSDG